ncbi:hypothetical protein V8F20_012761 [Naviculisporaceae sp. PSN 640]
MSNFGTSLKQSSSFLSRLARPAHRRTASNSSEVSPLNSSASDEQFAWSAGNTPSGENPPMSHGLITSNPRDGLLVGRFKQQSTPNIDRAISISATSAPIAISLPPPRQGRTQTPEPPLSARGELPGGYFPLHEDPASRVRHTHPFQKDTIQARRQSIQHSTTEPGPSFTAKMPAPVSQVRKAGNMSTSKSPQFTFTRSPDPATSASHTPISSYLPIGIHETAALPMGKYYPSNYENSMSAQQRQRPKPHKSNLTANIKSEPQVPKYHCDTSHTRTGSEVRRRLLQYQRDMIAQATVAATALLEKNGSALDPNALAAGSALKTISLGGTMLKTHKPLSPRLAPLGSPGPVTPMDLEAPGDNYLTVKPVLSTSHQVSTTAASKTSSEKAKQYQKGTHSPASQFHAASY